MRDVIKHTGAERCYFTKDQSVSFYQSGGGEKRSVPSLLLQQSKISQSLNYITAHLVKRMSTGITELVRQTNNVDAESFEFYFLLWSHEKASKSFDF